MRLLHRSAAVRWVTSSLKTLPCVLTAKAGRHSYVPVGHTGKFSVGLAAPMLIALCTGQRRLIFILHMWPRLGHDQFSGKAHGTPPAPGFVTAAKMLESRALSKFSGHFSPYLPLSAGSPGMPGVLQRTQGLQATSYPTHQHSPHALPPSRLINSGLIIHHLNPPVLSKFRGNVRLRAYPKNWWKLAGGVAGRRAGVAFRLGQ